MIGEVWLSPTGVPHHVTGFDNGLPVMFDGMLTVTYGRGDDWNPVIVKIGDEWMHNRNGHVYTVTNVVNKGSTKIKFPLTIVYKDEEGTEYACSARRFISKRRKLSD